MKLLVITQTVDKSDPVLGFMHRWLEEFGKNFEKVTVITLEKGEYNLPEIPVYSLGKEEGKSRLTYLLRFYKYIWQLRKDYDAVFVHMNQEYILLAGDIWRFMGKKVYLWRNHGEGSLLTRLSVFLSNKVFYTSPSSYTARFPKSYKMPVGIDTNFFKPDPHVRRIPDSVLFLGRISPIKKVLEFIDWVKTTPYSATIAGPILPKDKEYGEIVKHRVLDSKVRYIGPVTQSEALRLYQTHEIYVNKTEAGSFDKTIFEALACGCKLIVDNLDAQNINIEEHSLARLMERLKEEIR
ncbi:MAG TPA: hypothetical protein VJJ48_00125 [Candidatus Paceibacterota bacterium]